jgi:hypothetical protein
MRFSHCSADSAFSEVPNVRFSDSKKEREREVREEIVKWCEIVLYSSGYVLYHVLKETIRNSTQLASHAKHLHKPRGRRWNLQYHCPCVESRPPAVPR